MLICLLLQDCEESIKVSNIGKTTVEQFSMRRSSNNAHTIKSFSK